MPPEFAAGFGGVEETLEPNSGVPSGRLNGDEITVDRDEDPIVSPDLMSDFEDVEGTLEPNGVGAAMANADFLGGCPFCDAKT